MDNSLQLTRSSNEAILFSLVFLGTWMLFPVASIFLFLILFYRFKFSNTTENFMLLLMAISFGLIGYTTRSTGTTESDIARYYSLYSYIASINSAQDFFLSFIFNGASNILFYLITFMLAKLFPDNPQVLPLFWVSVTYLFSFLAIKEFVKYFSLLRQQYVAILFFSCVGVITFYTTTEIIKQTASVAIICYAIILKLRSKKSALFWTIVSLLVHVSSFLLLPIYILCKRRKLVKFLPLIFIICLALSFFNFNVILYSILSLFLPVGSDLLMRVQMYEDFETWTISFRFYAVFAMYFFLIIIFYWDYLITQNKEEKIQKQSLLIMHCLAFFSLLINLNNVHNFVRYVLGYFPFYMAAVIQLFKTKILKFDRVIVIGVVLAFYLYSNVKMIIAQTAGPTYANAYMNNDLFKIATSNVIQFLLFKATHV